MSTSFMPCGLAGRASPYLRFIILDDLEMIMARLLVHGVCHRSHIRLAVSIMSMAHVSNLRRPGEPLRESLRHPAAGRGAGNDRLDELARLIKQDDSFAQSQAYGAADPHAHVEHAPNWLTAPAAQARGQVDEALQPSPPPKRRGGLTIAAVVGLAVFGTGAVFAYRAWTSPATTSEPPLINAEQSPAQPS